jgi:ATP-dependent DNA ligase
MNYWFHDHHHGDNVDLNTPLQQRRDALRNLLDDRPGHGCGHVRSFDVALQFDAQGRPSWLAFDSHIHDSKLRDTLQSLAADGGQHPSGTLDWQVKRFTKLEDLVESVTRRAIADGCEGIMVKPLQGPHVNAQLSY